MTEPSRDREFRFRCSARAKTIGHAEQSVSHTWQSRGIKMRPSEIAEEGRPVMDLDIKLCPVPESTRQARNFVREHLIKLGFPKRADDASLVADELATNAVAAAPDTPFWVTLRVANGWPVLEVQDCSPELPVRQSGDILSEHGRGLHIVDALSVEWDSYPVAGGKVVWVLLDRD